MHVRTHTTHTQITNVLGILCGYCSCFLTGGWEVMTFQKCEIQNETTEGNTHTHTIKAVTYLYSCSKNSHQQWQLRNTMTTDYAHLIFI
jgi:hypothetical protein